VILYLQSKMLLFTDQLTRSRRFGKNPTATLYRDSNSSGACYQIADSMEADPKWTSPLIDPPSTIVGDFNLANLELAWQMFQPVDPSEEAAARLRLDRFRGVPGRYEHIVLSGPTSKPEPRVIVDYAHKPEALEKILLSLRTTTRRKLVLVFGCGGNRDRGKRPLMGAIAARFSDTVYLTSDNPRHEKPENIMSDIREGFDRDRLQHLTEEPDRRLAIEHAILNAHSEDTILVAGKGHEDCQDVAGERRPFSDVTEALAALRARTAQAAHGTHDKPAGAAA
jgi:UDP-N-acetylmuramyl-tripeptide synthetase